MKRNFSYLPISLLIVLSLIVWSCKVNDDSETIIDQIKQETEVESFFDEISTEVNDLSNLSTKNSSSGTQAGRVRFTRWEGNTRIDSVVYTDYVNPAARYSGVKNGVILLRTTFQHNIRINLTITFLNFRINGNLIEGIKTIVDSSQITYITLTNGKITFTDGSTFTREVNRTRKMLEGQATPYNIWDDVYSYEGTVTGVTRRGLNYNHQITNPIILKLNCPWIVKGVVSITVGDKQAIIDYGDGQCDNIAQIIYNNKTYEIKLRR